MMISRAHAIIYALFIAALAGVILALTQSTVTAGLPFRLHAGELLTSVAAPTSLDDPWSWTLLHQPFRMIAPLDAVALYGLAEVARVIGDLSPRGSAIVLQALLVAGVVFSARPLMASLRGGFIAGCVFLLLYLTLSGSSWGRDTQAWTIMVLPATLAAALTLAPTDKWRLTVAALLLLVTGVDAFLLLLVVGALGFDALCRQDYQWAKQQFMTLCAMVVAFLVARWFFRPLLDGVLLLPPRGGSSALYAAVRGFGSPDFHQQPLLALVVVSAIPLLFALRKVGYLRLATTLSAAVLASLVWARADILLFCGYAAGCGVLLEQWLRRRAPAALAELSRPRRRYDLTTFLFLLFAISLDHVVLQRKPEPELGSTALERLAELPRSTKLFHQLELADIFAQNFIRVFVDHRLELYLRPRTAGRPVLEDYEYLLSARPGVLELIAEHGITHALVASDAPLAGVMRDGTKWKEVARYARPGAAAEWILFEQEGTEGAARQS